MKTQKFLFLMTTISSLLFSCSTPNDGSNSINPDSSNSGSTSQPASGSTSSQPKFDNLDHVKVFVSKETNLVPYTYIYAWDTGDQPLVGQWPGTPLTTYDENWLTYDFESKYSEFSIILNTGTNGQQTSHSGMPINGAGAYWYYNDSLEKADTMPELNPEEDEPVDPGQGGGGSTTNYEYGNIFHAFDWSLNAIKSKLNDIADAGYTAIQTSPLQKSKEYGNNQNATNTDWWRLYQPASFSMPSDGSYLGSYSDMKNLTTAAHNKNIKIIVDIVANHMGGNGDELDWDNQEDAIKNNTGETIRRNGQCSNWGDRWSVTHQRIGGYPELATDKKVVQDTVYNYLKALIDNGVDGFRFDAAKHIETPFDNDNIKSSFWTNTATKAYTYANEKYNKQLYMYGEILDDCGGVPFEYYTNILDGVTDNRTGNGILSAIRSGNSNGAGSGHYQTNLSSEKIVIWGESHDTYMNTMEYGGITRDARQEDVDKAYALVGARKGSRGLYFCRPRWDAKIGSGATQSDSYKSKLVASVNKLKNDMGTNNETTGSSGSCAYVTRHGNNGYGASIVNLNGSGSVTLSLPNLTNGTYKDLISGNTYTMRNGSITVNINSSYGATVIEKVS